MATEPNIVGPIKANLTGPEHPNRWTEVYAVLDENDMEIAYAFNPVDAAVIWKAMVKPTKARPRPMPETPEFYDMALQVTDDVFGEGSYVKFNKDSPNPMIKDAVDRYLKKKDKK